jgi:hypothetical protein
MTVAVQTPTISYIEDGTTTAFPVPYRYDSPADLRATRLLANGTTVQLVNGTDFTATPGPTNAGGTLTLTTAGPSGARLTIFRRTARAQATDYITTGAFTAESHEGALDKAMLVAQELDADFARAIKAQPGETGPMMRPLAELDGKMLGLRDGEVVPGPDIDTFQEDYDAAIQGIEDAETDATGAIATARSGALTDIGAAGTTQVGLVNTAGSGQVAAIDAEGDTQVAAVGAAAAPVLAGLARQFNELNTNPVHALVTDRRQNVWLGIETATGEPVGEMIDRIGRAVPVPVRFASAHEPVTAIRSGVVSYGQSLSLGADGGPALTTVAPPWADVLTFGSGTKSGKPGNGHGAVKTSPGTTTTIPLICDTQSPNDAATNYGEEPIAGLYYAQELAAKEAGIQPSSFKLFGSSAGFGGAALSALDLTGAGASSWWYQLEDHIAEARARATAAGETYRLNAIFWSHGPADNTTAYATYRAQLEQMIADVNTRANAINPGNGPVHFLSAQLVQAGQRNGGANLGTPQRVIADLDREHPLFHLVAPEMDMPKSAASPFHLTNVGYWIIGRRMGRAFKQLVIEKRRPDAVVNIACWTEGTTGYALYRTPTRLHIDKELSFCGPVTDSGFRWVDQISGGNPEGTKIGIPLYPTIGPWRPDPVHGGTCLLSWQLERAPIGTCRMRYGRDYTRFQVTPADFNQPAFGNLRDTTPGSFVLAVGSGSDGSYPAYHPMAADDRPVTVFP